MNLTDVLNVEDLKKLESLDLPQHKTDTLILAAIYTGSNDMTINAGVRDGSDTPILMAYGPTSNTFTSDGWQKRGLNVVNIMLPRMGVVYDDKGARTPLVKARKVAPYRRVVYGCPKCGYEIQSDTISANRARNSRDPGSDKKVNRHLCPDCFKTGAQHHLVPRMVIPSRLPEELSSQVQAFVGEARVTGNMPALETPELIGVFRKGDAAPYKWEDVPTSGLLSTAVDKYLELGFEIRPWSALREAAEQATIPCSWKWLVTTGVGWMPVHSLYRHEGFQSYHLDYPRRQFRKDTVAGSVNVPNI